MLPCVGLAWLGFWLQQRPPPQTQPSCLLLASCSVCSRGRGKTARGQFIFAEHPFRAFTKYRLQRGLSSISAAHTLAVPAQSSSRAQARLSLQELCCLLPTASPFITRPQFCCSPQLLPGTHSRPTGNNRHKPSAD